MRNLLFILCIISSAHFAQAQDAKPTFKAIQLKANTISMPIATAKQQTRFLKIEEAVMAGIFILKHSRVKRALSFKVTTTNAKLV